MKSRYGDIGLPESMSKDRPQTDAMKYLTSAHRVYSEICRKMIAGYDSNMKAWYDNETLVEELYSEACRPFIRTELPEYDGRHVVQHLYKSEPMYANGLFLSAVLNTTRIKELAINSEVGGFHAGYRLGKGKKLVLGKNSCGPVAGKFSAGEIIHLGHVTNLSPQAAGGTHINGGKVNRFGAHSEDGIYINLGEAAEMGFGGGIHINHGKVDLFVSRGVRGWKSLKANFFKIHFTEGIAPNSLIYSAGLISCRNGGFPKGRHCLFELGDDQGLDRLARRLRKESEKTFAFRRVRDMEGTLETAKNFNFEELKKKVEGAAMAMEKYADGMYGIK